MKIKVQKLHPDAIIPTYATPGSSGFDLIALEDTWIRSGETKLVRTGLAMDVGYDCELQIRPRSGLSLNTPLRIANSPGTVDSDYRGEICIIVTNTSRSLNLPWRKGILVKKGDRIAQGVICAVERMVVMKMVESLDSTDRGTDGFGSSGT